MFIENQYLVPLCDGIQALEHNVIDWPDVLSLQVFAWYWPPVVFVGLIGVCVGLYHTFLQPLGAPNITRDDLTVPFTITGFALSLLLVFRTNTSYDRCAATALHSMVDCCTADSSIHTNVNIRYFECHACMLSGGGKPGRCGANC